MERKRRGRERKGGGEADEQHGPGSVEGGRGDFRRMDLVLFGSGWQTRPRRHAVVQEDADKLHDDPVRLRI